MDTIKYRLPMNLQLFALNANGVDESDTDDSDATDTDDSDNDLDNDSQEHEFEDDDDLDTDDEDDTDDSEEDLDTDDAQEDKPDPKSKDKGNNSTAAAVIAERKKWQAKLKEAEKVNPMMQKLLRLSGASSLEELQTRLDAAEASALAKESGLTPAQAQKQIEERREIDGMKQQIRDQKYEYEFLTLKKDPFFADIESYREEFQDIASRTGQTLEEVYMAKRGRERMKERETEIESRVKADKNKRQSKKVDTSTSGASGSKSTGKKVNLTPDQLQAAQYGVKKGHFKSIEEYAKYL